MTGLTFYGFLNRVGDTVACFVCGLDCGDRVVAADGSVTVPYLSDPDGLFTAAYAIALANNPPGTIGTYGWGAIGTVVTINSVNYTIPVAIGAAYTSRGQPVRPNEQHPQQNGSGLGKQRRVVSMGAYVVSTVGVYFGTDFSSTLKPAIFPGDGLDPYDKTTMYSGPYWTPVVGGSDLNGCVTWSITRPYPCTVNSITSFLRIQDKK